MAEEGTRVVIAFAGDKRRERGIIVRFRPFEPSFEFYAPDDVALRSPRRIEISKCKSIYFVRFHEGDKNYQEDKLRHPPVQRSGRKIEVEFPDGERMVGTTDGFNPTRQGFVFYPADPKSNNYEIFVVTANVTDVRMPPKEPGGEAVVYTPGGEGGIYLPEKRLEAVQRVLRGESVERVAKDLSVRPATVMEWRDRYNQKGPGGLGVGAVPDNSKGR